jgi:hypothetical protein
MRVEVGDGALGVAPFLISKLTKGYPVARLIGRL